MGTIKIGKKDWITIQEYMKEHGVSRQTVYDRIKAGKIKAKKVGVSRLIRVEE